jgi:dTDP-4-dehydrorhamnose reductase
VDDEHTLRGYLKWAGATDAELDWFRENLCPPDVVGVNHYVTSERYLDTRLHLHLPVCHGGNGRHRYVDVEAVRVLSRGMLGPGAILRQAWERYRRPVAVTEVHLGCTREEQLRWFAEVWRAACALRADGADMLAVTAWSAFGAFDWDSLVTLDRGHYETGAFDARVVPPRPTALAALVKHVAAGGEPDHPVLDGPSWWHRPERLLFADSDPPAVPSIRPARPLLVTGGTGALGSAFLRVCARRGLAVVAPPRSELDITDPKSVVAALTRYRPWAVVNAAGYGKVDAAETDAERCHRDNAHGPAVTAAACAVDGVGLVTFSSDLVFDGRTARPYREEDRPSPLSVYGSAKAEGDRRVLEVHPGALVVRTGAHFGPWDGRNFLAQAIAALRAGAVFAAADDLTVTPAYLPDLVDEVLDLVVDGTTGIWHLAPPEPVTWADFVVDAARCARLDPVRVQRKPSAAFAWRAPRPAYSALATTRGIALPSLADSLTRFVRDFAAAG